MSPSCNQSLMPAIAREWLTDSPTDQALLKSSQSKETSAMSSSTETTLQTENSVIRNRGTAAEVKLLKDYIQKPCFDNWRVYSVRQGVMGQRLRDLQFLALHTNSNKGDPVHPHRWTNLCIFQGSKAVFYWGILPSVFSRERIPGPGLNTRMLLLKCVIICFRMWIFLAHKI